MYFTDLYLIVFLTNAVARSGAKRYIGIWMSSLGVFRTKTLWFEIVRIRKMMRQAVRAVWQYKYATTGRYYVLSYIIH